jgi:hypothetical protein
VDNPHTHHDALEFPDGQIDLLTHLRAGSTCKRVAAIHAGEGAASTQRATSRPADAAITFLGKSGDGLPPLPYGLP